MKSWTKQGLLYSPDGSMPWEQKYALLPTPFTVSEEILRIYYSSLNGDMIGSIGYIELNTETLKIVNKSRAPSLSPGERGLFDDSGVNCSSVIAMPDGTVRMYYIGWQRAERVPYLLFSGLAISHDGGHTFHRYQQTPILDRCKEDPFIRSAPSVLKMGAHWHAWYVSGSRWDWINGVQYPIYEIRHALSEDGVVWAPDAEPSIKHVSADEFGLGRPWVIELDGKLRMWYSIRSRSLPYRIGYAESSDGIHWERLDNLAGISSSSSGWDSEMVCYAAVVRVHNKLFMVYNGNRHGSTGLGLALSDL